MKSNSKVIGVVVCIVCCIGALCILPLVTTNESDLTGWNPSSVYDGVISPSTSVFTDAVLEENNGGGMATAPRVTSTGSRMFHHTGASSVSMSAGATTSSYAGAPVHTTSSAMMGGTGSSISPISTSTARSSMGGASNGGGAIYATSSSTSSRSNAGGSIMSTGGSVSTSPTASRAMSPVMSAASSSSNPTTSLYAGNMSSNYGTASYGGYSGFGNSRMGVRGKQGASGFGNIGSTIWEEWLKYIADNEMQGWLYNGDGWEDGDGKLSFYDLEKLKSEFSNFQNWLANISGITNLPPGYNPTWEDFMNWWNNQSNNEDDWYDGKNVYFRVPLPDGVGVLLVLSLLCALFTFLRSRDKKAEAVEEQQS